jgi:hypothetical protein
LPGFLFAPPRLHNGWGFAGAGEADPASDFRRDRPCRSGRTPDWIKVKNPDAPAAMRIVEW